MPGRAGLFAGPGNSPEILVLPESADLLTQPSEQRDFVEWRRDRTCYAVWALDVDVLAVRQRVAAACAPIADQLLPGYSRQPHLTVHLCGFPKEQAGFADDYGVDRLAAEVAALRRARPAALAIEIGAPASFASAAYLAVRYPAGGIAGLRRILDSAASEAGFSYTPHVTIGLYRGAFPLAATVDRLAQGKIEPSCTLTVGRLALMSYAAAVIGGPLATVAEFDFASGELQVRDAGQMREFFGEHWPARLAAGKCADE